MLKNYYLIEQIWNLIHFFVLNKTGNRSSNKNYILVQGYRSTDA